MKYSDDFLSDPKVFGEIPGVFTSLEQIDAYFQRDEFFDFAVKKYGLKLPLGWCVNVNFAERPDLKQILVHVQSDFQNVPMPWRFVSRQVEVTEEDIANEKNIETRMMLIMFYGIKKYLKKVKTLDTHPAYGTLILAEIKGVTDRTDPQKFLVVLDGTPVLESSKKAFFKEKGMLGEDDKQYYYVPVPSEMETARQAAAWTWDYERAFPDSGYTFES